MNIILLHTYPQEYQQQKGPHQGQANVNLCHCILIQYYLADPVLHFLAFYAIMMQYSPYQCS